MKYDAVIVGGGIAGLTSAAFLCKSGCRVLLCEKEEKTGGLVGSFGYNGFVFDSGIRATENSGVLFPMLKMLGIELEFLCNTVSLGIEDKIIDVTSKTSVDDYRDMLVSLFPEEREQIDELIKTVKKIMDYMDILYGIDNPLFLDFKQDREYLLKTILPWMFKYITTVGKIKKFNAPVEQYLRSITDDEELIDMIAQHFFKSTPAFFALSYFSLYLGYKYPAGGTGSLTGALTDYILSHGGHIKTNTLITGFDPSAKTLTSSDGDTWPYDMLVWAADSKALYSMIENQQSLSPSVRRKIESRRRLLADKTGGDSVLTLYLTADLSKEYFGKISGPHFFYTPEKGGLGKFPLEIIQEPNGSFTKDKNAVFDWIRSFLRLNTFEISIPVLRDESLAPEGKAGLIISVLMDYQLTKHIEKQGWYDEFKELCKDIITDTLSGSVYPGLKEKITGGFVSTPLTIQRRTGGTDGAITGWAFTNSIIPAVTSMPKIASSVNTPIPDVVQAGQWTYSPSGLPIAILTGKLAAGRVLKKLKR